MEKLTRSRFSTVLAAGKTAKGIDMFDLMRKPAKQQAVKLPVLMVVVRKVCYVLAQKGDPTKTKSQ
ncbi:hypothetical protein BSPA111_28880 [Buttiauxella sp. A111]|nr:hypothetical protein BSPA111_28880 [Buttiauxella sp. A111]